MSAEYCVMLTDDELTALRDLLYRTEENFGSPGSPLRRAGLAVERTFVRTVGMRARLRGG